MLDIERIFTSKSSSKENEKRIENTYVEQNSVHVEQSSSIPNIQPVQQSQLEKIAEPQPVKIVSPQAPVLQNEKVLETPASQKVEEVVPQKEVLQVQSEPGAAQNVSPVENSTQEKLENNNQDYKFVVEELANLKKFYVSNVNEDWVKTRFDQWKEEKKSSTAQLQTEKDATDFLMPFWSPCNETWWTKEYADEIIKLLPENNAKQIVVWNPGCAKGLETYSLACVLKKHYPDSKIRIYAQDIDLLNISNAPLLSIPDQYATDWYAPYVTKKVSGEYTFTQEIKDIIMFEYHDCANSNSLPMIDIIFARDVLSLLPEESQDIVINDFDEKLKGNGIVIVGSHESLAKGSNWGEKTVGSLTYFNKL